MPPLGMASSLGLGAPRAATSSGSVPAEGGIPGESDVIALGPAAWWDSSYPDSVKSEDDPPEGETEATATNGQDVSKWISREGNDIALVQGTASKQPIWDEENTEFDDYSTINFNAPADTHLTIASVYVGADAGTIFYVGREKNDTSGGVGDAAGRAINWARSVQSNIGSNYWAGALFLYQGVSGGTPFGVKAANPEQDAYMATVSIADGSNASSVSLNGATSGTGTAPPYVEFTAIIANLCYQSGYTSVGGGTSGDMSDTQAAEFIIFDTTLSAANIVKVETYLQNKYHGGTPFGS